MDRLKAGEFSTVDQADNAANDVVDIWHDDPNADLAPNASLGMTLGMTLEEYWAWVEGPADFYARWLR